MNQTTGVKLEEHALYCIKHPYSITPTGQNSQGKYFHGDCPECLKESEQDKCVCIGESNGC